MSSVTDFHWVFFIFIKKCLLKKNYMYTNFHWVFFVKKCLLKKISIIGASNEYSFLYPFTVPSEYSGLSHINMVEQNGHQFLLVHSDRDSD